MSKKTAIPLIVIALLLLPLALALYYGGFRKVTINERVAGPYYLIFESNIGSYRKTGGSVERLKSLARAHTIEPIAGFGIYFDDPEQIPESQLRSEAGIMVSAHDLDALKPYIENFSHRVFTETRAAVTNFPNKGFISGFFGAWRIYPKMKTYLKRKGVTVRESMEIYHSENQWTEYLFPYSVQQTKSVEATSLVGKSTSDIPPRYQYRGGSIVERLDNVPAQGVRHHFHQYSLGFYESDADRFYALIEQPKEWDGQKTIRAVFPLELHHGESHTELCTSPGFAKVISVTVPADKSQKTCADSVQIVRACGIDPINSVFVPVDPEGVICERNTYSVCED